VTDESDEFWGVEGNIVDKFYVQLAVSRSIDPGHKVLQTFVGPSEPKGRESGGRPNEFAEMDVGFKVKILEAGQHGEASGHRLR
jgi:hypothetical protein